MSDRAERVGTLRRSSTTRSIGGRSSIGSINGDAFSSDGDAYSAAEHEDAVHDDSHNDAPAIGYPDSEAEKRRREADEHVAHYVQDQLERVRSNGSSSIVHDELEARLDGAADDS